MGNANCCGLGLGVPFGFEPDKQSIECHPLPPPHLRPQPQPHVTFLSHPAQQRYGHHTLASPPRHALPSSSPTSSFDDTGDSIIRTFAHLRHFPPEVFLPPASRSQLHSASSSPASLFLTHISSLDLPPPPPPLRHLCLDFNSITAVPNEIGLLHHLTELSLAGNLITQLPPAFYTLSQLSFVNLGSNQLTQLSSAICNLKQLSHLYLPSNQLTSLPPSLRRCERLQHLSLAENRIDWTDSSGGQVSRSAKKTTSRSTLSTQQPPQYGYGATPLSSVPPPSLSSSLAPYVDTFPLPASLSFLSLASCSLSSLPAALPSSLPNLTHLDLSENYLQSLPADLHALRRLRVLHLGCNQLAELTCPCEIERRRKAKEREERERRRREKEEREEERVRRKIAQRPADRLPSENDEEDNRAEVNNVLLTVDQTQQEEEAEQEDIYGSEHGEAYELSHAQSLSIATPRSLSHRPSTSFSAGCCFPDLNSLYLDNNALNAPPAATHHASPADVSCLSVISACFLPFSLKFLRLDGNPLLCCADGLVDNNKLTDGMDSDRKERRHSKDQPHDGLRADGRELQSDEEDLTREERQEVAGEKERQRTAARKRTVSFALEAKPTTAPPTQSSVQPTASHIDAHFRHGYRMSAVLATLSALQSLRPNLRIDHRYPLPSFILPHLYLGCWECAKNKHALSALHVSAIFTLAAFPPLYPQLFDYRVVPVQDVVTEDMLGKMGDGVRWIHERRQAGQSVLVHCR